MGLGTNQQTVTTGANFIPEVWAQETQRATESNLVAAKLVKRYDRDVIRKGDTVHVPIISNLTATSKSANTAVTFSSPTESVVDIAINAQYHIAIMIEDILDAQSAYDLAQEYQGKISYGLAKQIDTDILGLYSNITQSVGTAGNPPSDINFLRAIQYLDDADAPASDRAFIMAPACKAALLAIDKYVSQDFTGMDLPVKTGVFGQRYGIPFYVSTNIPTSGGNAINQLLHKEAYCAAIQKDITIKSQYFLDFLGMGYAGQVIYGVKTFRAAFGVQVLS